MAESAKGFVFGCHPAGSGYKVCMEPRDVYGEGPIHTRRGGTRDVSRLCGSRRLLSMVRPPGRACPPFILQRDLQL